MQITLAKSYGFCFGVKRAIDIAEQNKNAYTIGPLIHNQKEIDRLKYEYNVGVHNDIKDVKKIDTVIVRTHGITKEDTQKLKDIGSNVINATCPFVTTPQKIASKMSKENYSIIIFGDKEHPEVKGVQSYGDDVVVVANENEAKNIKTKYKKIAIIAQTTKQKQNFLKVIDELVLIYREIRVFNTICDATLDNQDATKELAQNSDIVIVVGGVSSSNTKQLHTIASKYCNDSYMVQDENGICKEWFKNKVKCGISAGASTPQWVIDNIKNKINKMKD
jgi:4-hydroxy-3-methylbut-2-enyl diphosphate reductase